MEGEDEWEREEEGGREGGKRKRVCALSGVFSYRCVHVNTLV